MTSCCRIPTRPSLGRTPLCLSLEDNLVHSEWTREHGWRVAKRPGVDYFLHYLSQYYEIVVFTSVPMFMAEPVLRKLDPYHFIHVAADSEATKYKDGELRQGTALLLLRCRCSLSRCQANSVVPQDLSYLNRDLSKVIIIDTKPSHVREQPENAIILPKWTGDAKDKTLVSLVPFLEFIHTMEYSDVRKVLKLFEGHDIPGPSSPAARPSPAPSTTSVSKPCAARRRTAPAVWAGSAAVGPQTEQHVTHGPARGTGEPRRCWLTARCCKTLPASTASASTWPSRRDPQEQREVAQGGAGGAGEGPKTK